MHSSHRSIGVLGTVIVALLALFTCLNFSLVLAQDQLAISHHDGDFILHLPPEITSALKKFDPEFTLWKTSDYTGAVMEDATKRGNPRRAPFALLLDVNRDSLLDVVMDGHDQKQSLLVCAVSDHGSYQVIVVERQDLVDPRTVETLDGGRRQYGLNYFLWLTEGYGIDPTVPAFIVGHPQQSDSLGRLLNDGGMLSYFYNNGAFRCEVEVP